MHPKYNDKGRHRGAFCRSDHPPGMGMDFLCPRQCHGLPVHMALLPLVALDELRSAQAEVDGATVRLAVSLPPLGWPFPAF